MIKPPSPELQERAVREVFEQQLAEGSPWYVVSKRWWNLWADYVEWDHQCTAAAEPQAFHRSLSGPQSGVEPPCIDNTHLTLRPTEIGASDGGPLQRDLLEHRDFILVNEAVWGKLHEWYGGGPILRRTVILHGCRDFSVELYPLQLMVYRVDSGGHADDSSKRPLFVSRKKTVRDLIEDIHRTYTQADAVPVVGDLRLWHRPDTSLDQTQVLETTGWEVVGPDSDTLESVGITDGVALLFEQRVQAAQKASEWPFFDRQRREYRAATFKDPHSATGPPLAVGDKIDASELEVPYGGIGNKKWYPATVIDQDEENVLLQFHYRKPPPKKMPQITKSKGGWFSSTAELSDETSAALQKVFKHYSNLDSDKDHIDKKAIASLISCKTNTICQQDDERVKAMLRDYDTDKDGLLTVDDFLRYWSTRASSSGSDFWLQQELERLYGRAKIDFGAPTEEEKLLQEGKEWVPRSSDRLAAAKSHAADYPYLRPDEREFRDFRAYDKVDLRVGKEWHPARIVAVDDGSHAVLVERSAGSRPTSFSSSQFTYGQSYSYAEHSSLEPGTREWIPIESERLAKSQTKSVPDFSDPSPKGALATPVTGACEAPGACGLNNLGNTCFMNATLQSLSHTIPLRQYFVSGDYKADICKCPLSMDGRLAHGFAQLLKMLWADTHTTVSPTKLKALVGEKRPEFQGYQQHDAQELLTFVLDGLHEDLNRVPYPRPIVEDPSIEGKDDQTIADEAWDGYLRRNNSRIVNIFQFQVRSEVFFPDIGEKSLTYDPMMYLTLPIPKPPHSVQVTVLPLTYPDMAPVKCCIEIPKERSFKDLEAAVSQEPAIQDELTSRSRSAMVPVSPEDDAKRCFIFVDLYDNRVYRFFNSDQRLSQVQPGDQIWAFEVPLLPNLPESQHNFNEVHLRRRSKSTSSYSSGGYSFYRFAPPHIVAIQPGVTTNAEIRARLMRFADRLKQHLGEESEVSLTVGSTYSSEEGAPLPDTGIFSLGLREALSLNFLDLTEKEIKLPTPAAQDAGSDKEAHSGDELTLESCLNSFQNTEELAQEDWLYCKKTEKFERSLKKLEIWTTPEILIIHLKRFGKAHLTGPLEKIDTFLRFPMRFDLAPWVRGPRRAGGTEYALHATVNHSGGLGGGHYTAYARVGEGPDRKWYYFNDMKCTAATEADVVTKSSYILFYERVREPSG